MAEDLLVLYKVSLLEVSAVAAHVGTLDRLVVFPGEEIITIEKCQLSV